MSGPYALRGSDGALWLWYAGPASSTATDPDRIWVVRATRLAL